jgi:hypothetical protein
MKGVSMWDTTTQQMFSVARDGARKVQGRITFDCSHAKVIKGERVICNRGNFLSNLEDGSLDYDLIAKGYLVRICKKCEEYLDING